MTNKEFSPTKQELLKKWLQGQIKDDKTSIPRRPLSSSIKLSFPQQRQLFLELLERGTAVNNLSIFIELNGILDLEALEQSANQIMIRHEVLRTHFSFSDALPTPKILCDFSLVIPVVDLHQCDASEQPAEARHLAEKEVLQPFDLTKAPLMRLKLYVLNKRKYLLLLIVHHSIADGWSLGVFLQELMTFYREILNNKSFQPPELSIQYPDYAHWQANIIRGEEQQKAINYWKKQLGGDLPVLELPTDQQRGSRQTFSGGTHRFTLSSVFTEALEKFNQHEDVTLFMTLLAAFYILLNRYSGQDDILIGTPIANRNHPGLEQLIGVFINTIVIRTNLSGDPSFRELLKRVRNVSLEAYAYQNLPFEKLVEELKPQRDLSRTPIFQVVFNMQNSPMPKLEIPGIEVKLRQIDRGVSQFDLSLMMSKSAGQWLATVEYNNDLFKSATIARMFQSFQLLLEDAITRPDHPISRLHLINTEELHRRVYELNQTHLDFPSEKCLHQLIESQTEQTPNTVAVIYDHISLTYDELNQRANRLARLLQILGVGPGVCVGIFMKKSSEIITALLSVLKAGGTYVPIHTSFPEDRVRFILHDANVHVLLTNENHRYLDESSINVVNLNDADFLSDGDGSNLETNINSDHLAYIIYTSGSTGYPKGVMVHHSALVNFLWSMRERPGIKKDDVLLSVTAISFDISALELFLPLTVGATVIIASKEMTDNPVLIGQAISCHNVNIMQATPATWQLLLESGWTGDPGLKALCGGDALTRTLADQLFDRVGSLWNMYGPTETTVWSSLTQIQKKDDPITIGQPIGNTQIYILDRYLQPLPVGVIGEIHIGGEGLAKGYVNLPHLTNEKFIPDCFSTRPEARLYKTGDLARYLPDYSIEILGRMDDQVKIHGHRIELGEITSVLMQHEDINEAITITRREASGDNRIVAYITTAHGKSLNSGELRDFIRKKLPNYMIPAVFVQLNNMPLTANGKIDRKSLPVPEDIRQLPGYVAPRNEVERSLARIWQDVLDIEQVGIHDNFFDLGGASMQSLQVIAKANMYGLRLSVENIFEHQTISELVDLLKRKEN